MSMIAKRRIKMWWRLNSDCAWQPALPEGSSYDDAKVALLLAVKTIYKVPSRDIEVVETLGSPADAVACVIDDRSDM